MSRLIDKRVLELSVGLLRHQPDLRLIVEITETAAIADLDESVTFVDTVKEFGCRVAIDDFGAGYTSFHNLKHLGADMAKIDGTFIKNLATDPSDRVFVEALVHLAKSFGMETVAEWVGDQKSVDILAETGVTYLQGYHFGEPKLALYGEGGKPKIVAPRA